MTDLVLKNLCVGTLSNVSLTVPGGQVVCLSGPSGSGKSRLLRAVADLEPHGGTVSVADTCQEDLPAHQWRSRVVMVPADSQWGFDGVGGHFPGHVKAELPSALGFPPEVSEPIAGQGYAVQVNSAHPAGPEAASDEPFPGSIQRTYASAEKTSAQTGFSTDCLETLEELCIRGDKIFLAAGGEELRVLPCLNASPEWTDALAALLEPPLSGEG